MNKEKALDLLEKGKKVKHKFFSRDEFVMQHPRKPQYYLDEEGNSKLKEQFWKFRDFVEWEKDWSEVKLVKSIEYGSSRIKRQRRFQKSMLSN